MNAPLRPQAVSAATELLVEDAASGIVIDRVSKVYPARSKSAAVVALDDVSLSVREGSIVGVIGRSGAGKSSLIRLVNGLEKPTQGRVIVNGTDVTSLKEPALRNVRRSIGMIFQHFNLLSSRTAFDNIALPLEIAGVSQADIAKRVGPLLEMVGLADKRDRYPAELSGGQKQRVGIARALATNPNILLSDEATSALDPETTQQILELLRTINRELRLTILFITHEMAVVKELADRVAVLESGKIIEEGSTFEVFASPRHEVTRRFVSSVTSSAPPAWLVADLRSTAAPGAQAVLQVSFKGTDAGQPLISDLARTFDVEIRLLSGRVEMISGHPFGSLTLSLAADPAALTRIIHYLTARGNLVEHLGYVS